LCVQDIQYNIMLCARRKREQRGVSDDNQKNNQLFRKRSHPGRGHRGSYRTAIQTDGRTDRQTDNRNLLLEEGQAKGLRHVHLLGAFRIVGGAFSLFGLAGGGSGIGWIQTLRKLSVQVYSWPLFTLFGYWVGLFFFLIVRGGAPGLDGSKPFASFKVKVYI